MTNSQSSSDPPPKPDDGTPKVYRVPRRFNLPSVFVMTTLLAGVCAILRAGDAHVGFYLFFAVMTFVTCVAQIYAPRTPRLASTLGGGIGFLAFVAVAYWINPPRRGPDVTWLLIGSGFIFLIGAFGGYLFGTMAASVFLITDRLFRRPPKE
jgi:hypothetical protein